MSLKVTHDVKLPTLQMDIPGELQEFKALLGQIQAEQSTAMMQNRAKVMESLRTLDFLDKAEIN